MYLINTLAFGIGLLGGVLSTCMQWAIHREGMKNLKRGRRGSSSKTMFQGHIIHGLILPLVTVFLIISLKDQIVLVCKHVGVNPVYFLIGFVLSSLTGLIMFLRRSKDDDDDDDSGLPENDHIAKPIPLKLKPIRGSN